MALRILTLQERKTLYDEKGIKFEVDWGNLEKRLQDTVGIGGWLQEGFDHFVFGRLWQYTPLRTGALIASGEIGTIIGSGEIVYIAPYARRQYYEGRLPGESQAGALRGRLWFERAKNDELPMWERVTQEALNRGGWRN